MCSEEEKKKRRRSDSWREENPTTAETQVTTQRLELPDTRSTAAEHLSLVTHEREEELRD